MKIAGISYIAVVAAVSMRSTAIPIPSYDTTTTRGVTHTIIDLLFASHDGPEVTETPFNSRVEWEPLPEVKEASQLFRDPGYPQEDSSGTNRYCRYPGQGCQHDVTPQEPATNPLAHSESFASRIYSHLRHGYSKMKRSEEPAADPESDKTDALPNAEDDVVLNEEPEAKEESSPSDSSTQPEVDPEGDTGLLTERRWCRRPGQGCFKAKRFGDPVSIPEAESS